MLIVQKCPRRKYQSHHSLQKLNSLLLSQQLTLEARISLGIIYWHHRSSQQAPLPIQSIRHQKCLAVPAATEMVNSTMDSHKNLMVRTELTCQMQCSGQGNFRGVC